MFKMFLAYVKQIKQITYANSIIENGHCIKGKDQVSEHISNFFSKPCWELMLVEGVLV